MKIALLDPPSYTPAYDHHLASALAARGHEVDLLTSPFVFGDAPAPEGYERRELFLPLSGKLLRRAPRSRLRYLLKGAEYLPSELRLVRGVAAFRPDVVHVQWLAVPRYDLRWVQRLRRDRPVVLTAHNVLPHEGEADAEQRRRLYGAFDRIVVHTRGGAEQLERFGVPAERIVRIQHGTFAAPPANSIQPPSGRTLLFYGLIRRYKGLDVLIRALPEAAQLTVVGSGGHDPRLPERDYPDLLHSLAVGQRVRFAGAVDDAELANLYRQAVALVLPSVERTYYGRTVAVSELLGLVALEAMASATPVIASGVGGLQEVVEDGETGFLSPPGDETALRERIEMLLGDPARAARMGARARERVLARWTWEQCAERCLAAYRELVPA